MPPLYHERYTSASGGRLKGLQTTKTHRAFDRDGDDNVRQTIFSAAVASYNQAAD
jgi:hypothetical protein